MMLDDVTSGFNMSNNLSIDVRYNEILGFTEDEVEFLIDECGIDRAKMTIDRKFWYNGYMFHEEAENKLYSSAMILYLLYKVSITEGEIKYIIDDNLKTDYSRIKLLLKKPLNIEKLKTIIETNSISAEIVPRFSIDKIHDPNNFPSMLYYMGLVTIDKDNAGAPILRIPNYSIKTMYWEYMENIILDCVPEIEYNANIILTSLRTMALRGDYNPFFENFHKNFVSQISNRDLSNLSEKDIKFLLLSILFQTDIYIPISEPENTEGYIDVYLKRRSRLYPKLLTDWVFEMKYIKNKDAKKTKLIEEKKSTAVEQLKRYKSSNLFKDRTDVRYLAVVFIGKKKYWIEELI
jgi:hypothetical protein